MLFVLPSFMEGLGMIVEQSQFSIFHHKTLVLCTPQSCLTKTILTSAQNMCFWRKIKLIFLWYMLGDLLYYGLNDSIVLLLFLSISYLTDFRGSFTYDRLALCHLWWDPSIVHLCKCGIIIVLALPLTGCFWHEQMVDRFIVYIYFFLHS